MSIFPDTIEESNGSMDLTGGLNSRSSMGGSLTRSSTIESLKPTESPSLEVRMETYLSRAQVRTLYRKKADSLNQESCKTLFLPDSILTWTLEFVIFMFIVLSLICLPLEIFGLLSFPMYVHVVFLTAFAIDFLMSFFKAYYDEQDGLMRNIFKPWTASTAQRYLFSRSLGNSAVADAAALVGSVSLFLNNLWRPDELAFRVLGFLCLARIAKMVNLLQFLSSICLIHEVSWHGRIPFHLDVFLCLSLPIFYLGHFLGCAWLVAQGCSLNSDQHGPMEVYLDNLTKLLPSVLLGGRTFNGCDDVAPLTVSACWCASAVCSMILLSSLLGVSSNAPLGVECRAISFLRKRGFGILECRNIWAQLVMSQEASFVVHELLAQEVITPLLMEVRQFQHLDEVQSNFAQTLAVHCALVPFKAGEIIIHEGSDAAEMLVVSSGEVRYLFHTREDRVHASGAYPTNSVIDEIALVFDFVRDYAVQGTKGGEVLFVLRSAVLLLVGMHASWRDHWQSHVESLQAILQGGDDNAPIQAPQCPECNNSTPQNMLYFLNASRPMAAPGAESSEASNSDANQSKKNTIFATFLSHSWDSDQAMGGFNHQRVVVIHNALQKHGVNSWLDTGGGCNRNISQDICQGIDQSLTFAVFVTKGYLEKVKHGTDNYCGAEFCYACVRLSVKNFIPVILDSDCREQRDWEGPVGMRLGNDSYCDFSDVDWTRDEEEIIQDPSFQKNLQEFIKRINSRKSNVVDNAKTVSTRMRRPSIAPNMINSPRASDANDKLVSLLPASETKNMQLKGVTFSQRSNPHYEGTFKGWDQMTKLRSDGSSASKGTVGERQMMVVKRRSSGAVLQGLAKYIASKNPVIRMKSTDSKSSCATSCSDASCMMNLAPSPGMSPAVSRQASLQKHPSVGKAANDAMKSYATKQNEVNRTNSTNSNKNGFETGSLANKIDESMGQEDQLQPPMQRLSSVRSAQAGVNKRPSVTSIAESCTSEISDSYEPLSFDEQQPSMQRLSSVRSAQAGVNKRPSVASIAESCTSEISESYEPLSFEQPQAGVNKRPSVTSEISESYEPLSPFKAQNGFNGESLVDSERPSSPSETPELS